MTDPGNDRLAPLIVAAGDPASQPAPGRFRAAAMLIVLGVALVWSMLPFAAGIFGAAVLYVLSVPAYRWMVTKRVPKGTAASLTLLIVLLVLLVPGGALVNVLLDEVPAAVRGLNAAPLIERLQGLRVGPVNIGEQLGRASGSITSWASSQLLGIVGGVASGTLNLVIALLGLYYLLISADDVWPRVKQYLPFTHEDSEDLRQKFYQVTLATALGMVVVAVVQGTLVGIAFSVLGLPNAVVWGTVAAIGSILPLVGSALVWVPGSITLFALGQTGEAIGLALFGGVVVSNIDNIMRPMVQKRVGNLHPLTTLLGAFAGVQYAGLIGVLLGPLAITWFFELLVIYDKEYGLTRRATSLIRS